MKYRFEGEIDAFETDRRGLEQRLAKELVWLKNYEELAIDQVDDDAYVARGNGFCDSKYSPEFIDNQIEAIKHRINQLRNWIDGAEL